MPNLTKSLSPGDADCGSCVGVDMQWEDPAGILQQALEPKTLRATLCEAVEFRFAGTERDRALSFGAVFIEAATKHGGSSTG